MSLRETLTPDVIYQAFVKVAEEVDSKAGKLVLITDEHYDNVKKFFVEEFVPDEPTAIALDVGMNDIMDGLYEHMVTQNMSLMMVQPETGEIMGIRIMGITNIDDPLPIDATDHVPTKTLLTFWKHCDDQADYVKRYNAKEYITFMGLGVAKKYRRQGIATRLMQATLSYIKNFGVSPIHIKGGAASTFSSRIYDTLEYDLLYKIKYVDYIVDGKQVICDTGGNEFYRAYGKEL